MIFQRNQEIDFLYADLASINHLIDGLQDEDFMTRTGLESRREELKSLIQTAERKIEIPRASATLYFGGSPVNGMRGIEIKFASSVVAKYQDLVSMVLANNERVLSQKGRVVNCESSKLFITSLVRGAAGFVLEEFIPKASTNPTSLTEAVNETTKLLESFGTSNEEQFKDRLVCTNQQIINCAGKFFNVLHRNKATLRLVTNDLDHSFGVQSISRGALRAGSTTKNCQELTIIGRLTGILPDARQFEFIRCDDGFLISGEIASCLDLKTLAHV